MSLVVRPVTLKQSVPFVRHVHRRLPDLTGAMWSIGVFGGGRLVGVAVVGVPRARMLNCDALPQSLNVLEVARVAVLEGIGNACSMLYGACARAGRGMCLDDMVTYTHGDEHGVSLRASGWVEDPDTTTPGEWDRSGRQREMAVDPLAKRRWWAAWGKRARAITARTQAAA